MVGLSDLKKIGLSEGEIKMYRALLRSGESTRTELAKKSGVSPSKIYDVARRLHEKGIISIVKKNGITHFSAANPERLYDFLEFKKKEISGEKKLIDKMMPILLGEYTKTEENIDVEVFYGWDGMKTVYKDIAKNLSRDDENCILGASQGINSKKADRFFLWYYHKVDEKGYRQRAIFNENVRENRDRVRHFRKKKHEARFLYQDTFTEINFYKNVVLFIMLLEKPIVIRIKCEEAAKSFKIFFEEMWRIAKR